MKKLLMLLLCALCLLTAASALAEETDLGEVLDRVFSPEALYTPVPTQTPSPTGTPRPAEPLPTTEAYRNDEKTIVNGEGGMYNIILDDEECLLSDEEKEALLPVMRQISRYGTVAFYTTDRSGSVDNKAMAYFDRNISRSSLYSGVIFMIDMNARQIYIFSRGEIEKYVTRSDAYAITADVSSYATAGDYFTCANEAYQRILGNLEGQRMYSPARIISGVLMSVALGMLIAYMSVRRRSLQPMPDPKNMTDRRDLFTQTEADLGYAVLLSTDRRVRSSGSSGGYGGGSGGGGGGGGGGGSGGSGGGSSF